MTFAVYIFTIQKELPQLNAAALFEEYNYSSILSSASLTVE